MPAATGWPDRPAGERPHAQRPSSRHSGAAPQKTQSRSGNADSSAFRPLPPADSARCQNPSRQLSDAMLLSSWRAGHSLQERRAVFRPARHQHCNSCLRTASHVGHYRACRSAEVANHNQRADAGISVPWDEGLNTHAAATQQKYWPPILKILHSFLRS